MKRVRSAAPESAEKSPTWMYVVLGILLALIVVFMYGPYLDPDAFSFLKARL